MTANDIIRGFQQSADEFGKTFKPLTEHELNFKPASNVWSIAQIMEHIIITNETYYSIFENVKQHTNDVPAIGRLKFLTDWLGNMLVKSLSPDAKRKTKTFPIWEPTQQSVICGIIEKFATHHSDLIGKVNEMQPFLNQNIIISSPANRFVVYSLDKAFEILLVHEKRHYQQALGVLSALKK